jgi:hypothetical protein
LFMLGVVTDDANDTLAPDHLALVADALHRSSNFHL